MSKLEFLQGFLRSPLEVGSVIPSSKYMVDRVISYVKEAKPKTIVELGAGTGVFTQAINNVCGEHSTFIAFEKDEGMRDELKKEFPLIQIESDAVTLTDVLEQKGLEKVDCIISALPLTLFSKEKRDTIMNKVYQHLDDNGCFIMYQYTPHMRKQLKQMYDDVKCQFIIRNFPPTFLYFCKK